MEQKLARTMLEVETMTNNIQCNSVIIYDIDWFVIIIGFLIIIDIAITYFVGFT